MQFHYPFYIYRETANSIIKELLQEIGWMSYMSTYYYLDNLFYWLKK